MSHAERTHARYSFSNMHRIAACPGMVDLVETIPAFRRHRPAADDGTRVHELIEFALTNGFGTEAADDATFNSVHSVLDHVSGLRSVYTDLQLSVEQPIPFPQTVVPPEDCGGIVDIVGYSPSAKKGWIIDYKNGIVHVDAAENWQLRCGAAYFWQRAVDEIDLTIIQPNGFKGAPIRTETIHAYELLDVVAAVEDALRHATEPNARLNPGDHCMFCEAEAMCLAREEYALKVMTGGAYTAPAKVDFSAARRAEIMRNAPQLRRWLKAVEDYARDLAIRNGEQTPGFKVVESSTRRHFEGDVLDIAESLIDEMYYAVNIDDVAPRQLLGLGDIEALLKRHGVENVQSVMAALTVKAPSGNYALVPDTDKRPAANPMANLFSHVTLTPPEYST